MPKTTNKINELTLYGIKAWDAALKGLKPL